MNKNKVRILIVGVLIVLNACKSNPFDVQLEGSSPSIEYINVDEMLSDQPVEIIKENVEQLSEKLGNLFIYELSNNIRADIDDSSYQKIYNFYNDEYIQDLESEKKKLQSELGPHEEKINLGFRYLSHYFGDTLIPKQIFYINTLFSQMSCSEINISVGLENYISKESEVIKSLPGEMFPIWQRERMNIDYLERDVLLAWIQFRIFSELDGKLAEHIIQAGKKLYVLNATLPFSDEAYILRYSKEDYDWAEKNESLIWNYLVKEQMLFQSDVGVRLNFLSAGPKTGLLSKDAPDRLGRFLGYKIVKGYMRKNKTISLQELLDTKYNIILQSYEIR